MGDRDADNRSPSPLALDEPPSSRYLPSSSSGREASRGVPADHTLDDFGTAMSPPFGPVQGAAKDAAAMAAGSSNSREVSLTSGLRRRVPVKRSTTIGTSMHCGSPAGSTYPLVTPHWTLEVTPPRTPTSPTSQTEVSSSSARRQLSSGTPQQRGNAPGNSSSFGWNNNTHVSTPVGQKRSGQGLATPRNQRGGHRRSVSDSAYAVVGVASSPTGVYPNRIAAPLPQRETQMPVGGTKVTSPTEYEPQPAPGSWSLFYNRGLEVVPPPRLHFLYIGRWATKTCDYYRHRRPVGEETLGHRIHWLHNARHRDRFIFVVEGVEKPQEQSLWRAFWTKVYGTPPAYAEEQRMRLVSQERSGDGPGGVPVLNSSGGDDEAHHNPSFGSMTSTNSGTDRSSFGSQDNPVLHIGVNRHGTDHHSGRPHHHVRDERVVADNAKYGSGLDVDMTGSVIMTDTESNSSGLQRMLKVLGEDDGDDPLPNINRSETVRYSTQEVTHGVGRKRQLQGRPKGVEVVEIMHSNITGLDYYSGLMGNRLAMEVAEATTTWYPEVRMVLQLYGYATEDEDHDSAAASESGEGDAAVIPSSGAAELLSKSGYRRAHEGDITGFDTPLGTTTTEDRTTTLRAKRTPSQGPGHGSVISNDSMDMHVDYVVSRPVFHRSTIVNLSSQDPHFNAVLREVIMPLQGPHPSYTTAAEARDQRLLKLYEAGMPSWAMFCARWGIPYRRWFRLAFTILINLYPVISLGCGLYDIYKNMPYVSEFMHAYCKPFIDWMDMHVSFRFSMFITYLVTVSLSTAKGVHTVFLTAYNIVAIVFRPLQPIIAAIALLRYPVVTFFSMFAPIVQSLWFAATFLVHYVLTPVRLIALQVQIIASGVAPGVKVGVTAASGAASQWNRVVTFWQQVARPVKNMAKAIYDGIVHVGMHIVRREESVRRLLGSFHRMFRAKLEWAAFHCRTFLLVTFYTGQLLFPFLSFTFLFLLLLGFLSSDEWNTDESAAAVSAAAEALLGADKVEALLESMNRTVEALMPWTA